MTGFAGLGRRVVMAGLAGRGGRRLVMVVTGLGHAGAEGDHRQGDADGSEKAGHGMRSNQENQLAAFYTAPRGPG
jgi:hypothetical protein